MFLIKLVDFAICWNYNFILIYSLAWINRFICIFWWFNCFFQSQHCFINIL